MSGPHALLIGVNSLTWGIQNCNWHAFRYRAMGQVTPDWESFQVSSRSDTHYSSVIGLETGSSDMNEWIGDIALSIVHSDNRLLYSHNKPLTNRARPRVCGIHEIANLVYNTVNKGFFQNCHFTSNAGDLSFASVIRQPLNVPALRVIYCG